MKFTIRIIHAFLTCILAFTIVACEDFVAVELPNSQLGTTAVFDSEPTATAAATGMYVSMVQSESFAGGLFNNVTYLSGLSGDELIDHSGSSTYQQFFRNSLTPNNSAVLTLWSSAYRTIYEANALLEGIESSDALRDDIKRQLEGEAKFVRAFCHFYLTNLFGDVPLITSTDYRKNSVVSRTPATQVYAQVTADLKDSQNLLTKEYFTDSRTRPNKWAASALLARVHLYMGAYADAESEATSVITASETYQLESDLNKIYLANSNEAIWQLTQVYPHGIPTGDAFTFLIYSYAQSVNPELIAAFEPNDSRRTTWLVQDGSVFYPFKYKTSIYASDSNYPERLVVLRLAEQYLIRAEARLNLNNPAGAVDDLNIIRNRAGLDNTLANDNATISEAIENERRFELFAEFGHRWLDLRRTNRANDILPLTKPEWNPEDALYPIPESEMLNNTQLRPQNPGY